MWLVSAHQKHGHSFLPLTHWLPPNGAGRVSVVTTASSPTWPPINRETAPSTWPVAARATTALSVGNPIFWSCWSRREETDDLDSFTPSSVTACREAWIPACSSSSSKRDSHRAQKVPSEAPPGCGKGVGERGGYSSLDSCPRIPVCSTLQ